MVGDGMETDIRVDRRMNHPRKVSIYDRLGGAGNISLTEEEAKIVQYELTKMFGPTHVEENDG